MLSIGAGVQEYLRKAGTDSVVITLIPNRIPVCCGGQSRKYYTPDIRPAKPGEQFAAMYQKLSAGGVHAYITPRALEAAGQDIVISLENIMIAKKLSMAGIPPIIYADD
jgi:hypothetical protein